MPLCPTHSFSYSFSSPCPPLPHTSPVWKDDLCLCRLLSWFRQPTLLPTCTSIFPDCLSALQIYLSSTWQTFYSIIDQKFNTKKYLIRFWEFPCDKYICFLYLWWRISINSGWITSFASLGGKWCLWERKCCFWKKSWIN